MKESAGKTRVTVIDDHELVREGLRLMLSQDSAFEFCCGKDDAEAGLACVREHKPDLCVVDISMPGLSGIDAVRRILQLHPECKLLVLSAHDEAEYAARAFRAGAHGYIMKQEKAERILAAIRKVAAGEMYMSDPIQRALLHGNLETKSGNKTSGLTDRELEVLRLIGQGFNTAQIAERLHRSPKTVDVHRQNIKQKLDIESAADLVRYASRWIDSQTNTP
jgi:two-component system, NarL family, response regulator NreC